MSSPKGYLGWDAGFGRTPDDWQLEEKGRASNQLGGLSKQNSRETGTMGNQGKSIKSFPLGRSRGSLSIGWGTGLQNATRAEKGGRVKETEKRKRFKIKSLVREMGLRPSRNFVEKEENAAEKNPKWLEREREREQRGLKGGRTVEKVRRQGQKRTKKWSY